MAHIVFDMMGVIYEEGWFVSRQLAVSLADVIEPEALRARYLDFTTGKTGREEFWRDLADDPAHADQELVESLTINPSLDAIRPLLAQGGCALLSEIPTTWGHGLLKQAGLEDVFDPVVLSGEARCTKPGPEIFRYLLERMDADPRKQTVYFIDDKLENLAAGAAFDLVGVWYRREDQPPVFDPPHVIESLADILALPGVA